MNSQAAIRMNERSTATKKAAGFQTARRINRSITASIEKRALLWMAERAPGWLSSDPVSYTHLTRKSTIGKETMMNAQVTIRMNERSTDTKNAAGFQTALRTVSYTHLDVYKRQDNATTPINTGHAKPSVQIILHLLCSAESLELYRSRWHCKANY